MNSIARTAGVLFIAGLAGSAGSLPANAADASAVATAHTSDRPDLGSYRYELLVTWGPLSHNLSHLDLLLTGLNCPCLCQGGRVSVAVAENEGSSQSPAVGREGGCPVAYSGVLACDGDPAIAVSSPVIKWEPRSGQSCQPGKSGSGLFVFYSKWPPGAEQILPDAIRIKEGQLLAFGDVRGNLPNCQCATSPNEASSWGGVKSTYR